ncbi:MAG: anti-sigma factor [Anaerolineales bacterium]|nr:anti-sigma factor [Anaerolineales bacterium]
MKPETHATDQIPAYALNILDAAEAAQVEAHLAACAACQQELQAYQEVVAQLALAVPVAEPSPALKGRLLQEISKESPVPRTAVPPAKEQPNWWQNWRTWFTKRPLWQPVLVIALLLLLISNFQLRQQVQESNHPAGFGAVTLSPAEPDNAATGLIIISADGLHGTLIVQDLPVLAEPEAYQLWLIKDGQRTSGGVFNVNDDGYRAIWLDSEEPLASYKDFDITLEPAGGSPYPTGDKVLGN